MSLFSKEVFLFEFSVFLIHETCVNVEPMSERSNSTPSLMASLFSARVLVEYRASFASNFDLVASCFGE
jgi:hypothetical protein